MNFNFFFSDQEASEIDSEDQQGHENEEQSESQEKRQVVPKEEIPHREKAPEAQENSKAQVITSCYAEFILYKIKTR